MFCFVLDFSPDSKFIAVSFASWDAPLPSMLRVWDVTTGQLLYELSEPVKGLMWLAFSPDGKLLAASLLDSRTIKLWDVASGEEVHAISSPVQALAFSPDGKLLAGALHTLQDFRIKLWRVGTWEEVLVLPGHTDVVSALAFSPAGNFLALSIEILRPDRCDETVHIWRVADLMGK
ncbi:MAG: WD40 repeat domain-containing protein [Candidatus Bipolaricaulaceae bacterium]